MILAGPFLIDDQDLVEELVGGWLKMKCARGESIEGFPDPRANWLRWTFGYCTGLFGAPWLLIVLWKAVTPGQLSVKFGECCWQLDLADPGVDKLLQNRIELARSGRVDGAVRRGYDA